VSEVNPRLFGRMFVVLGLLFAFGALFLLVPGKLEMFADNGNADATQVGWLFFAEGIGFAAFGMLILRQHWVQDEDEATGMSHHH
jgi:hypothetical protein